MNISAIPKISFKSNTPVYHVFNTNKDNTVRELNSDELKGPVLALVKRLNSKDTDEFRFFRKFIPDFVSTPIATSTIIGSDDIIKSTVIYGADAINVNELRNDYYVNERYSKEDIISAIKRLYVRPWKKRAINQETNQAMGLVLHTKSKGHSFKLENVDIVDIHGNKIASLHAHEGEEDDDKYYDQLCYDEYLQEKKTKQNTEEEYSVAPEELEEEFEDLDKYFESYINSTSTVRPKLVQGELFECFA